jgi:23S rRNA (adenine2030-N6)-methyltransferase
MNYRHAYHAGNFADVLKHTALVAVLQHLRKKDAPFAVIDTHGGRGLYDLTGTEASRTAEARTGIGRLRPAGDMRGVLKLYTDVVRSFGEATYPGSPLIAARMMRPQDRLIAVEKHPGEFAELKANMGVLARARAVNGDGYVALARLLPPPERRAAIMIDPPYEAADEFEWVARAFVPAYRRFATGVYLIWFPLKAEADAAGLAGEMLNAGVLKLARLTLDVGRAADAPPERLAASGMFVVNPPYGFEHDMRTALDFMVQRLGQGTDASGRYEWLAGGE